MKVLLFFCLLGIFQSCAKRTDITGEHLPKEIENNPTYKFALIFDKALSEEIKNKIKASHLNFSIFKRKYCNIGKIAQGKINLIHFHYNIPRNFFFF